MDKRLRSELKSALFARFARARVSYDVFARCGAYVYRSCAQTWFRDVQRSHVWACLDYDNDSCAARTVERLFDASLVRDVPAPAALPTLDDVLANPPLLESYLRTAFPGDALRATYSAFFDDAAALVAARTQGPATLVPVAEARRVLDIVALVRMDAAAASVVRTVRASLTGDAGADTGADTDAGGVSPLLIAHVRNVVLEAALAVAYPAWIAGGAPGRVAWQPADTVHSAETGFLTPLLAAALDGSTPLAACATRYGRPLFPGTAMAPLSGGATAAGTTAVPVEPGAAPEAGLSSPNASYSISSSSSDGSASVAAVSPSDGAAAFVVATTAEAQTGSTMNSSSASGTGNATPTTVGPGTPRRTRARMPPLVVSTGAASSAATAAAQTETATAVDFTAFRPRVPTLDETLDSVPLRRMFEDYYLLARLPSAADVQVWRSLSNYAAAFARLSDDDFAARQDDLRAQARTILDLYPSFFRKEPFLASRLAKKAIVTVRFFREEEYHLYSLAHQSYQKLLEKSGWLPPLQ